jgi:hypothetical protein
MHIAKWDGVNWSAVGTGMDTSVFALGVYNGELYAGGLFTQAGGVTAKHIAKWDGTNWSAVGTGTDTTVRAFCVYNGDLYVGGDFITAGGVTVNHIAKWNSPLGIDQNSIDQKINIYPNPTEGAIHIENFNEKVEITIQDILGEEKKKINLTVPESAIDVSDLPEGVYFVAIKNKEGLLIKKIIVQH